MRHQVKNKRVGRNMAHLDAMLGNLASSIILYEKVKTTQSKAKIIKPILEKMISMAKNKTAVHTRRHADAFLPDKNASMKLTQELSKRYAKRNSGFLRLTPLGYRAGDAAPMVQIELV